MKTNALLLATAALGALVSQATAATETFTLTLPPGFCLKANHLNVGDNSLIAVLPAVPVESQVLKFANNNYVADIFDGSVWLEAATGEPSSTKVSPGEGFFFFNPTSQELQATLTGDVPQGVISICLRPGFSLVGSPVPRPFSVTAPNLLPRVLEMQILRFDCGRQSYRAILFDGSTWIDSATGKPANDIIPVGEGFFVFNPEPTPVCWIRNFSVE
jgi:hypothetical protein